MSDKLDRLWNGWRSTYVVSNGREGSHDPNDSRSVFTQIRESGLSDSETNIVFQGDHVFAIMNAFPYSPGHVLVLPKREIPDLENLNPEEQIELWSVVRDAVTAVQNGECVVVYPEGTITRDPELWPMDGKTGAARIALATGAPLIPAAMWGPQDVIGPYRKEFRILPRKTMHVAFGPPVDLADLMGQPMDTNTLRIATDRLLDAITDLLAETRQTPPPAERFRYHRKEDRP